MEPISNLLVGVTRVFVTDNSWEGSGAAQLLQKRAVLEFLKLHLGHLTPTAFPSDERRGRITISESRIN
jgi:hypothetical protein